MTNSKSRSQWEKFEWIRAGESGGPREGYAEYIFSGMSDREKDMAERILLGDLNRRPFAAQGLALLMGEECLTGDLYKNISYNKAQLLDIYGVLLRSNLRDKYLAKIAELFPLLSSSEKRSAGGYLISSKSLIDRELAKSIIKDEKDVDVRYLVVRALFLSVAKISNDFRKDIASLYKELKEATSNKDVFHVVDKIYNMALTLQSKKVDI